MTLERMKKEHLETLTDLEKLCFSTPWSKASLKTQIDNPRAYFLVAMLNDSILGYGGMHIYSDECYMDNLAVFGHHRNKGVGTAILVALCRKARRCNARFISLEVRPSNRAVTLYKRLGFEAEGLRKNFYSDPREDALILTKRFPAADEIRTPYADFRN